ncbi:tripartite tricarboxylate transporter substrate-binding protein, partial [Variovorax sp. J22R133]|uniref:tripartite tricarboxylate transporter substrate-binding protein n=1 Tax=Variovorax brevis TaxID=3053503 RepID=UPI00257830E2
PTGTPPEAIEKINKAMNASLARPEVIARLKEEGSVARGGSASELGAFMKSEYTRWGAAVRESGAKLD